MCRDRIGIKVSECRHAQRAELATRIDKLERDLYELRMDAAKAKALELLSCTEPDLAKIEGHIERTAAKLEHSRAIMEARQ